MTSTYSTAEYTELQTELFAILPAINKFYQSGYLHYNFYSKLFLLIALLMK